MEVLTVEKIKMYSRLDIPEDKTKFVEVVGEAAEEIVQYVVGNNFGEMRALYGSIPNTITSACYLVASTIIEPMLHEHMINCVELPKVLGALVEPYSKRGICQRIHTKECELGPFLRLKIQQAIEREYN